MRDQRGALVSFALHHYSMGGGTRLGALVTNTVSVNAANNNRLGLGIIYYQ
jgi:hypothetical protein